MIKLIKINFLSSFSSLMRRNGKRGTILFVLLFLLVAVCFGCQCYDMALELPNATLLFFMAGMATFFFLIFALVLQSQNYFFHTKDYEMLASMPISKVSIVISKAVAALCTCYLYQSIILIPAFVVYSMFAGFQVSVFFAFLLCFIVFPLFPLAVSFVISMLMHLILTKARLRTLVNYILMVILFAACFASFYLFSEFALTDMNVLQGVFPSIAFFFNCLAGDWLYLLYSTLLGVGAIVIALVLVTLSYRFINQGGTGSAARKNGKLEFDKTSSLLKFEAKRYFSTPMYVFNTIIGPIFILIIPFLKYIIGLPLPAFVYIGVLCLMLSMTSSSACSISIEGSKINLLKSLPIRPMKIFLNKILFNILLTLPSIVVCDILLLSLNSFVWFEILALICLPPVAIILFASLGLVLNLYFPKLQFTSINEVVKQSLSVFLAIFSGLLINLILLCVLPMANIATWLMLLIYAVVLVVLLVVVLIILFTQGEKQFKKLSV
ncbi:MAG: hypothetical protein NC218_12335 [Acetobacter sp.]|nr:hypothetical protein [Acetobacter sp.]